MRIIILSRQLYCLSMQTVQLRAFVIMTSASEVERQLRAKPDDFVLKPNEAALYMYIIAAESL